MRIAVFHGSRGEYKSYTCGVCDSLGSPDLLKGRLETFIHSSQKTDM